MKILHIISSLETGGAQRLLTELLPLLALKENISLLIFNDIENEFQKKIISKHITLYSLKQKNFYNPLIILKLIPILKRFDIVHVHLFPCLYWVAIASLFSKTHLVYTEHSTNNKRRNKIYFKYLEKWIYSFYEKIISISKQTQNNLKIWLNASSNDERFITIENGINIETFTNIEKTPKYEIELPKGKRILMISRFTQSKDQQTLIRAMMYVAKNVHLILVGNGETPIFPIQIWKKKRGVNYLPEDKNYDLYQLACEVTAKRFFPNFINLDATFNQHPKWNKDDPNRYYYECATMGCRTRVFKDRHGEDTSIGRGNLSFTTVNLVRIAIEAAKEAQVDHFVRTLPEGYNTILNEESTNISQGQKQLLTIARAFLADPKILILDEATSSVDTRTEILIQKAMESLMKGRTSFVIAHRLSTIRDADMILVMNQGDIVEQGTHEELLAKGGFYEKLYNSQFEEVED